MYKQSFQNNSENKNLTDGSNFATTLIPLQLISENGIIFWYNHASQSPRFCRPIKLEFVKETDEVILS